jgi:hypothetical protein
MGMVEQFFSSGLIAGSVLIFYTGNGVVVGGSLVEIPEEVAIGQRRLREVLPDGESAHSGEVCGEGGASARAEG